MQEESSQPSPRPVACTESKHWHHVHHQRQKRRQKTSSQCMNHCILVIKSDSLQSLPVCVLQWDRGQRMETIETKTQVPCWTCANAAAAVFPRLHLTRVFLHQFMSVSGGQICPSFFDDFKVQGSSVTGSTPPPAGERDFTVPLAVGDRERWM